jgi:hypothetical protein
MKKFFCLATALLLAALCLSVQPARAADSAEAMRAYGAVLLGKTEWYHIDDKKNLRLNQLKDENGEPLKAQKFAVVDMDSDGTLEVVVEFHDSRSGVVVLHYEDGEVYGFNNSYTYYLAKDGTYNGLLPAWCSDTRKVTSITKDAYKEAILARVEADPFKENAETLYFVNEVQVTENQHRAFLEKLGETREGNEAVWHDCTSENIASVCK